MSAPPPGDSETSPGRRERPSIGRKVVLLARTALVLVVVGGLGLAWVANRPSTARACTGGATTTDVGGASSSAALGNWQRQHAPGVDLGRPDQVRRSEDRVTATYRRTTPPSGPTTPDRARTTVVVVERDRGGTWRVAEARDCEEWTA